MTGERAGIPRSIEQRRTGGAPPSPTRTRAGWAIGQVIAGTFAAVLLAATPAVTRAEVTVEANLSHTAVAPGEPTQLEVVVQGSRAADDPIFEVPSSIIVSSRGRSETFSWINGRSSTTLTFRYLLVARQPGSFSIGPIEVRVGRQRFVAPPLELSVSQRGPAAPGPDGVRAGREPVSLLVDVVPRTPYAGQPAILRVRLVQRVDLAETPNYTPPPTPGFWAERTSSAESYYADVGSERVLVTESRARVYPLIVGRQTIGPAHARVVIDMPGGNFDPFGWFGGGQRRVVQLESRPVPVDVRTLPGGAPTGFRGAVGRYQASWTASPARAALDQPVILRLDVRGVGNLPLLRPPELLAPDLEVLGSGVEDSLTPSGTLDPGRRAFRWTVLPRRQGMVSVAAPQWSWFDPIDERYRVASLSAVTLEVGPPTGTAPPPPEPFPAAFTSAPLDPWSRPARPWGLALAGGLLGLALVAWRAAPGGAAARGARAGHAARIAALERARGDERWRLADEACAWLAAHGAARPDLQRSVAAARYGGQSADDAALWQGLIAALRAAQPASGSATRLRAVAMVAAAAAVALVWFAAPRSGTGRGLELARAADRLARSGDLERAAGAWRELWRSGARAPGLAARLAWIEVSAGRTGHASAWVMRGEGIGEPDRALEWVRARVRESGGLSGAPDPGLPVPGVAWGMAALVLGAAAGVWWPRRAPAIGSLALAVALASIPALETAWRERSNWAVVLRESRLERADLMLEPGRVVVMRQRDGDRARVQVARDVEGWLPLSALHPVGRSS